LKDKHAEVQALLGQARARVEQTRQGSLVEEALAQDAVAAAAALPSPVTLIEDDGLDMALSQSTLVETERDRLIRTGMLTPFDRLDGFERRVRNSVTAARDNANAILNSRPQTKLLTADEIPKQYVRVSSASLCGLWTSLSVCVSSRARSSPLAARFVQSICVNFN
jgi:hypothetical protein